MDNVTPEEEHGNGLSLEEFIESVREHDPQATEETVGKSFAKMFHPSKAEAIRALPDLEEDHFDRKTAATLAALDPDLLQSLVVLAEIREQGMEVSGLRVPGEVLEMSSKRLTKLMEQRLELEANMERYYAAYMPDLSHFTKGMTESSKAIFDALAPALKQSFVLTGLTKQLHDHVTASTNIRAHLERIRDAMANASNEESAIEAAMEGVLVASEVAETAFSTPTQDVQDEALMIIERIFKGEITGEQIEYMASEEFTQSINEEWAEDPLTELSLQVLNMWIEERVAYQVAPDMPPRMEDLERLTLSFWQAWLDVFPEIPVDHEDDLAPRQELTTGKLTRHMGNLFEDSSTANGAPLTLSGGKGKAVKSAYQTVQFTNTSGLPVEIVEFDKRVMETVGAVYAAKHEGLRQRGHAIMTDLQLTRLVFATPPYKDPTDQQVQAVRQSIDKVKEIRVIVGGSDYRGNQIAVDDRAIPCRRTVMLTTRGTYREGYVFYNYPPTYEVETALGYARRVDGLLAPRKGGYRPASREEQSTYTALAREIIAFRGSRFDASKVYEISLTSLHNKIGGIYNMEEIEKLAKRNKTSSTPRYRRMTVRNWAEKSLNEFVARGLIEEWEWKRSKAQRGKVIGIAVKLPETAPDFTLIEQEAEAAAKKRELILKQNRNLIAP